MAFAVGAASTVDYNLAKMISLLAISGLFMLAAAIKYRRGAKEIKPKEVNNRFGSTFGTNYRYCYMLMFDCTDFSFNDVLIIPLLA